MDVKGQPIHKITIFHGETKRFIDPMLRSEPLVDFLVQNMAIPKKSEGTWWRTTHES